MAVLHTNTLYRRDDIIKDQRVVDFDTAANGRVDWVWDDNSGHVRFRVPNVIIERRTADPSPTQRARLELTPGGTAALSSTDLVSGDNSSVNCVTGALNLGITGSKNLRINNDSGTAGQALLTQGIGAPPVWGTVREVITTERVATTNGVVGVMYPMNTTGGALTLNPPSSPVTGDFFSVTDSRGNAATNNITVDFVTAGQNLHGSSQNAVLNTTNEFMRFHYIDATVGWIIET